MGLRSEKAVSAHLLLENAHESNLVSDISKVDYLAGNLGRTHLRPLSGLPTFVDDVFVFGYLRREDCVAHGGRLSCTTGEVGAAKNTIARISTAARESMGTAPDDTSRHPSPHTGEHRPHNRNQRHCRRYPSHSCQDRVRHRQKGAGEVARAVPCDRTGRHLLGKSGRIRNPYWRQCFFFFFLLKIATVTLILSPASCLRYYTTQHLYEVILKSIDKCRPQSDGNVFLKKKKKTKKKKNNKKHSDLDLKPRTLKVDLTWDIIIPNICVILINIHQQM